MLRLITRSEAGYPVRNIFLAKFDLKHVEYPPNFLFQQMGQQVGNIFCLLCTFFVYDANFFLKKLRRKLQKLQVPGF